MSNIPPGRSARAPLKDILENTSSSSSTTGNARTSKEQTEIFYNPYEGYESYNRVYEFVSEGPQESVNNRKRKAPQRKQTVKQAEAGSGGIPPPAKKPRARGTRGVLRQIMEMPFDIIYEIFTRLPPGDLLSVGRTSKGLKKLVMSDAFNSIWILSLSATGIPPCPQDINYPTYAAIAFGVNCWGCGSSRKKAGRYWEPRLILCRDCIYFDPFVIHNARIYYYRKSSLPALPESFTTKNILPAFQKGEYCKQTVDALFQEYTALSNDDEKSTWEADTLVKLEARRAHDRLCITWRSNWDLEAENRAKQELEQRKERAIEIAKEMGWAEEISRMTTPLSSVGEITRACSKPFDDRTLAALKEKINIVMTRVKENREAEANKGKIYEHMNIFKEAYTSAVQMFHPPTERYPHVADVFILPRISSLILDLQNKPTLRPSDFKFDAQSLPSVIKEANEIVDKKILQLIPSGYYGEKKAMSEAVNYNPDTVNVLNLATTLFTNPDLIFGNMTPKLQAAAKERSFLTFSEVLKCSGARVSQRNATVVEKYSRLAFEYYTPWHASTKLMFHQAAHKVAKQVLRLCQMDPETTTEAQMERVFPIVECAACCSLSEGRLVMSWDAATSHVIDMHGGIVDPMTMWMVNDEYVCKARDAIKEKTQRWLYIDENAKTVCNHCTESFITGALPDMMSHLLSMHYILYPNENDFEFAYTYSGTWRNGRVGRPDGVYRMWPPGLPCSDR